MNLVEEEADFFEDLYCLDFEWHPHLENKPSDEEYYELTIKDRHIIRIVFRDARIPRLPGSIANLTHLEEVELKCICFEKFPEEIFSIPNL